MIDSSPTYECMTAAGRDPSAALGHRLVVAGCGNAGSNLALSLAVLGVTSAYIDPDRVEAKNLPHSPFLTAAPGRDGLAPFKAELLARAHVSQSRRADQRAYWAAWPIQAVPLGILRTFDGIIIGIDDGPARAWAARAGALLGIPTIVAGFYPPTGNFVATTNRDADAPCYFCLRPDESPVRASCSLYSSPDGRVNPALQTVPAATMNVALEAMLRFWQDDFLYDGKVFRLDLGEGSAEPSSFLCHPSCPGPHEHLPEPARAPLGPEASAAMLLELARRDGLAKPALELPSRFIVSLPCRACGAPVPVGLPDWALSSAPACPAGCEKGGRREGPHIESRVGFENPLADRSLRTLGLGPLALAVVEDAESDELRVYELPGAPEDLLMTVRKEDR
jgi:hypothetical protein